MQSSIAKTNWSSYESSFRSALKHLQDADALNRIYKKDPLVWTDDASHHDEISRRLGWLTADQTISENMDDLKQFQSSVKEGNFRYTVLLGMGGSSLGPEVLQTVFGNQPGFPELIALDSTDPRQIHNVEIKIGHQKTLFIVASKSGTTIESISLYKYFYNKVKAACGESAGDRFVGVTDPGMALIQIGKENAFRRMFINDPDVGGRYSVLTLFGLVPAAAVGMDLDDFLNRVKETAGLCRSLPLNESHPAADLGIGMGALSAEGRDKLTIVTPDEWGIFGDWAEQLIAESVGKNGKGIVPVVRETLADPSLYSLDRFFIGLYRKEDHHIEEHLTRVADAGHPVVRIVVDDEKQLISEFYRWELATALAGAVMAVDPFDQPNVQEAKTITGELLKGISSTDSLVPEMDTFKDSDIRARAGKSLQEKSQDVDEAWKQFWASVSDGDYIAILAFLPSTKDVNDRLRALAGEIRLMTRKSVTIGLGPRYLHSTGQLHKGGANNGLFLVLTAPTENGFDLPVPDVVYSFRQLQLAQARGDFNALEAKGRRVFFAELKDLSSRSFSAFTQLIDKQF